jgi:hypothetical protein
VASIWCNECNPAPSPKSFFSPSLCPLPGTMSMRNISRSLDRGELRIPSDSSSLLVQERVLLTWQYSFTTGATIAYSQVLYAYQGHRGIPVRFSFFKGLCAKSSWFTSFALANSQLHELVSAKSVYINAFKTRIRGATVCVPPLASVLQMAEPRECSSSCSLISWLGSRWFCICVECFTSNYSSNCSRWLPTKLYWLGIPRDLSLTCFPCDCFDFSRLVYAPFRSS